MSKTYYTYRIQVANYELVQVEKWSSQHQPLGEPSGIFRYGEKQTELKSLIDKAENDSLESSDEVRQLGELLFDVLFDDVLCRDFVGFYEQAVHQDRQLLRIELVIDEQGMPDIAALPWEFMCLPRRENLGTIWLSTAPEVVFSRRRAQYFAAQPIQLQKGEKLRIALVVASPPDVPAIDHHPIQEALEQLAQDKPDLMELLPILEDASPESIDQVLSQKPHVVHFLGNCGLENDEGQEVGVFLVDPDLNQSMWVEAYYFSELLNQHRPGLVILQASHSGALSSSQAFAGVASRVLQQNIPVIVAMQYDVSKVVASQFPRRFYEKLAEGEPVDIAAQYGRRAIALGSARYEQRDFATPIIFMRVEDGYLFEQYEEEPPPPSTSVEMRRRLETAMPQQCQVGQPTEVRVMVALHDSPGLRATLPDYTESGELIEKNDVVQNEVPLEFPVDRGTQEPLPINVFVSLIAPGFKVEQPAKSIRVSPRYDSGIVTFFLTPSVAQKSGRVVVEWFGDEQKSTLLGSLTLITEIFESEANLDEIAWAVRKSPLKLGLSETSEVVGTTMEVSGEGAVVLGGNVKGSTIITGDRNIVGDKYRVQTVHQKGKYNIHIGDSAEGLHIGDTYDVDQDDDFNISPIPDSAVPESDDAEPLIQDDVETYHQPEIHFIRVMEDTLLKQTFAQSSYLADSQKFYIKAGFSFPITAFSFDSSNHVKFTLGKDQLGQQIFLNGSNTWYAYAPDIRISGDSLEQTIVSGQFKQEAEINEPILKEFEFVWAQVCKLQDKEQEQWIIRRQHRSSSRFTDKLNDAFSLEMVALPGGVFVMGSLHEEIYHYEWESPAHEITIPPLFVGRYPTNQALWRFVADLPQVNRELHPSPSRFGGDQLTVEQISWLDAVEFCDRLSRHTGRHYRLPTEAEWEYACRAGTTTPFHYGETITSELANYQETEDFADGQQGEYRQTTTPVDYFGVANAFGLSDMHGNVWEWCLDHWHDNYAGAPTDGSAWLTEQDDAPRVIRGGSWSDPIENCRSASRRAVPVDYRSSSIGFRVVCSIP